MIIFDWKRLVVTALVALTLPLAATLFVEALQAAEAKQQAGPKRHKLAATLETTQWGWLDPNEAPKLTVNSGDIVSIETMMHSHNKIQPGTTMEEIVALRKANPGGGPHSVTGPIYVNGAEPGDVMEIRILTITPKPFGVNFNLPGKDFPTIGALAPEFPEGFVKYFNLDWKNRQAEFKPGITIDVKPFPGTLAVGIDPNDPAPRKGGAKDSMSPVSTLRPWKNGSNMDLNELQEGSTHLRSGLSEGRAGMDRRLALPAGKRRGQSHGAGVCISGHHAAIDRPQGHETRVAASRDQNPLDLHGLR